jgi:hypothetical protein
VTRVDLQTQFAEVVSVSAAVPVAAIWIAAIAAPVTIATP